MVVQPCDWYGGGRVWGSIAHTVMGLEEAGNLEAVQGLKFWVRGAHGNDRVKLGHRAPVMVVLGTEARSVLS